MPTLPDREEMLTIVPDLRSRMIAAARRVPFQVPLRCTLITWSNWSSVIVRMVASRVMPALLTITSSDPNVSTVCASIASISAALVTSQRATAATSGPPSLAAAACGRLEVEVAEHDPRPLPDEHLRDGEADALRAAGDDRGTSFEDRHERFLPVRAA